MGLASIAQADEMEGFEPLPTGKETDKNGHFATAAMRRFNERYKATLSKAARTTKDKQQPTGKIVGGVNADPGGYPWMAALVRPGNPDNFQAQFCGGSLVHPYWVVTAAHCVEDLAPGSVEVLLGAYNLETDPHSQRYAVVEVIVHPDFRTTTLDADLALLRLAEPADPSYLPLRLIDDADLAAPEVMAKILGWGTTTYEGDSSEILLEADLPVVSLETANATAAYDGELTGNMLPAGYAAGGTDSCQGDSGGPLVVADPGDGAWMLAGITSYGAGCGDPNAYGIYARVSNYRPFVVSHLWPSYAKWEQESGVAGEVRDPDGDGRNHFGDFAFGPEPGVPPRPGFRTDGGLLRASLDFRARGFDGVAAFGFEHADSPGGPWTAEGFDDSLVVSEDVAGMAGVRDVTVVAPLSPPPSRLFLRASAAPSGALVPGVRGFDTTRWANGALAAGDAVHPDQPDRLARTYRLENLVVGVAVEITGRSGAFDMRLELLDGPAGAILATADSDAALGVAGTDERLAFTPVAGVDYHVRVSPSAAGEAGGYHLGSLRTADFGALPLLGVPTGSTPGTLSAGDPADPLWLPKVYYSDDHRLAAGLVERIRVNLDSGAFDAYLYIVDAETGRPVMEDDDSGGGLNASAAFRPVPGVSYIVRATSASSLKTGSYTLSTQFEPLPTIIVPTTRSESLTTSDEEDPNWPGYYKDDYELINVVPGQVVTVTLNSNAFDAYLYLVNAVDGSILDENDDGFEMGTNSEIVFTVEAGMTYILRASSLDPGDTGNYTLTTQ